MLYIYIFTPSIDYLKRRRLSGQPVLPAVPHQQHKQGSCSLAHSAPFITYFIGWTCHSSPHVRHKPVLVMPEDAFLFALSPFPGHQGIK